MSNNHGVESSTSPSRRSVVKGAAWAVPAVVVAGAAPTVAASEGLLSFTGRACKLPGNSSSTFKGFVFEMVANNVLGPNPRDAITEITNITVQGIADVGTFKIKVVGGNLSCTCSNCAGTNPDHVFCTPDGVTGQRVFVYTSANITGTSANSVVTVSYRVFDCNNTVNCGSPSGTQTATTLLGTTPPTQEGGGGSCPIPADEIFPLP
ncbi:hypothetical protein GCM10027053_33300 [Intrasporangium mesophilum]